ncbi:MAG: 16S rRNA (adenine(1518)-N(6)/adenine(1519)-N(6))-dimethyltransferase RsmA [Candidatus Thorarchaeota archaeon]
MNFKDVKLILTQLDFKPKKHLGQNFITSQNIIDKIINLSDISREDTILEVGPGIGALTKPLIEKAKKVYVVEIDQILSQYLSETFSIYDNIEIINDDILRIDIPSHNKVVSNLPYKITGPILEKLFFRTKSPQGILTIEKSIANRLFLSNNYKRFSRISIGLNAFMNPVVKYPIPRNSFYPIPKIDLALVKIIPKENLHQLLLKEESVQFFLRFIAGIMPYKNKNLVNALFLFYKANRDPYYTKEKIFNILKKENFENKKLFNFEIEEFIELSRIFYS